MRRSSAHGAGVAGLPHGAGHLVADRSDGRGACALSLLSCTLDHGVSSTYREDCRPGVVRQAASGRDRLRFLSFDQAGRAETEAHPRLRSNREYDLWALCRPGGKSCPSCDAIRTVPWRELLRLFHFDKVKDVMQERSAVSCRDPSCHMEPSSRSSTSKRGAMTRAIGRHWFRGVVVPAL